MNQSILPNSMSTQYPFLEGLFAELGLSDPPEVLCSSESDILDLLITAQEQCEADSKNGLVVNILRDFPSSNSDEAFLFHCLKMYTSPEDTDPICLSTLHIVTEDIVALVKSNMPPVEDKAFLERLRMEVKKVVKPVQNTTLGQSSIDDFVKSLTRELDKSANQEPQVGQAGVKESNYEELFESVENTLGTQGVQGIQDVKEHTTPTTDANQQNLLISAIEETQVVLFDKDILILTASIRGKLIKLGYLLYPISNDTKKLPYTFIPAVDTQNKVKTALVKFNFNILTDDFAIIDLLVDFNEENIFGTKVHITCNTTNISDICYEVDDTNFFETFTWYTMKLNINSNTNTLAHPIQTLKKTTVTAVKNTIQTIPESEESIGLAITLEDESTKLIPLPITIPLTTEEYIIGVTEPLNAEVALAVMEGTLTLTNM